MNKSAKVVLERVNKSFSAARSTNCLISGVTEKLIVSVFFVIFRRPNVRGGKAAPLGS